MKETIKKIKELVEKLPKYDLSKNGIDGEIYIRLDQVLEIINNHRSVK